MAAHPPESAIDLPAPVFIGDDVEVEAVDVADEVARHVERAIFVHGAARCVFGGGGVARNVVDTTTMFMILFGLAKGALFGLLVGFIGCAAGMQTKSTADGVGAAATSAVVGGMVAIALSDGVLAVLCYIWNL